MDDDGSENESREGLTELGDLFVQSAHDRERSSAASPRERQADRRGKARKRETMMAMMKTDHFSALTDYDSDHV